MKTDKLHQPNNLDNSWLICDTKIKNTYNLHNSLLLLKVSFDTHTLNTTKLILINLDSNFKNVLNSLNYQT